MKRKEPKETPKGVPEPCPDCDSIVGRRVSDEEIIVTSRHHGEHHPARIRIEGGKLKVEGVKIAP